MYLRYCTVLVILFHLVAGQSGHRESEKPQAFPVRLCGPAGLDSFGDFRLQTWSRSVGDEADSFLIWRVSVRQMKQQMLLVTIH